MSTTLSPRDSSEEEGLLVDLVRLTSLVDPEALEAVILLRGALTRPRRRLPGPLLLADLRTPQPGLPTELLPEDTWLPRERPEPPAERRE